MFNLWSFSGGIHLHAHKEASSEAPLKTAKLPEQLVYPLQMRAGANARPCVEAGEQVRKGQVIAEGHGPLNPPIHAATSGRVRAIEARALPHPSGLADLCIVIDADGEDAAVEFAGAPDYRQLPPAELRRRIHQAGIVGLGGASFPTAVKVDPGERRPLDTLILNGAECEPYITCDDSLLRHCAEQVLGGAKILMHILQVERCLLGIENDMPQAIASLQQAQAQGDYGGIEIVPVPAIYPTGGEKQLIKVLTGREVPARGIPADCGVVCQNVGTAAAVHQAIVLGEPLISRIVTLTGPGLRQPQNLLARIGTPIADLVAQCGGYTPGVERLIMGGPMMGFALPTDDLPIVKATNCILALTAGEAVAAETAMPCIRCGECASACPVGLLPQQLYWYSRADHLERVLDYQLPDCIECGCCDYVCPSHIPLVQYFRAAKSKLAAKQRERSKAEHARERFEARQARKQREKLEKAENDRRKKALLSKAPEIRQAMEQTPPPEPAEAASAERLGDAVLESEQQA